MHSDHLYYIVNQNHSGYPLLVFNGYNIPVFFFLLALTIHVVIVCLCCGLLVRPLLITIMIIIIPLLVLPRRTKWSAHEAHEPRLCYFTLIFIMLFIYLLQIISKLTKKRTKKTSAQMKKKQKSSKWHKKAVIVSLLLDERWFHWEYNTVRFLLTSVRFFVLAWSASGECGFSVSGSLSLTLFSSHSFVVWLACFTFYQILSCFVVVVSTSLSFDHDS